MVFEWLKSIVLKRTSILFSDLGVGPESNISVFATSNAIGYWRGLATDVRTLASMNGMRSRSPRGSAIANPHIELQGYRLWWKTGVVVAGLITNLAVNCELARQSSLRGRDQGVHGESLAVDVQLLFRSEGKADVLSGRIGDSARHDVARRLQADRGGDQQF